MGISKLRLVCLIAISFLEICLFGGLQMGWFSLLYILKQENVYGNLCVVSGSKNASYNGGCYLQDEKFNLLFSIGMALFNVAGIIPGMVYFKFSTRAVRACSVVGLVAGVLCFGFTSPEIPWLVLPGIVFVGVSGLSLMISNMQVAVLLSTGSSIYVGLLNGCYDSSVITQMVIKALYENGIDRIFSYSGIAIVCVVISGLCTLLHPSSIANDSKTMEIENDTKIKDSNGIVNDSFHFDEKGGSVFSTESNQSVNKETENGHTTSSGDDQTHSSVLTFIGSSVFISHVIWMSALLIRFYYFLGAINRFLGEILENDEQDSEEIHRPFKDVGRVIPLVMVKAELKKYPDVKLLVCSDPNMTHSPVYDVSYFTDVLTYTMLGGIMSSFIAGQVFELQKKYFTGNMRTVIPLTVTSCLAVLLSSLDFVHKPAFLYAEFIVLTFFRSFIYSVNMDFVITIFPQKYMSVLFGLVISVSGVVTLTQYALFTWTERYEHALTHVKIFLLCLTVVSLFHPILVFVNGRKISLSAKTQTDLNFNQPKDRVINVESHISTKL